MWKWLLRAGKSPVNIAIPVEGDHLSGRKADRGPLQKEPIHGTLDGIARQRVEKEIRMMIRTGKQICRTGGIFLCVNLHKMQWLSERSTTAVMNNAAVKSVIMCISRYPCCRRRDPYERRLPPPDPYDDPYRRPPPIVRDPYFDRYADPYR